jgi:Flp pilus assembly protein TadG
VLQDYAFAEMTQQAQQVILNVSRAMKHSSSLKRKIRRRGATMVEFALVITLLLVLSLGLIQYGVLMNKAIALSHVSREGGRYAAVRATQPNIDKDIKQYIVDVGNQNGLSIEPANIQLSPAENTTANPTRRRQYASLTITLTYNMSRHLFLPATFFGAKMFDGTRTETTQMVIE